MKNEKLLRLLSPIFLLLGLVSLQLQRWLFADFVQDPVSGLLPFGTLPEILLWVLTGVVILAAFLLTRGAKLGEGGPVTGALSDAFFAAGILTLLLEPLKGPAALVLVYKIFCVLTALSLIVSAVLGLLKRKAPFLLSLCPAIACILQLLEYYQSYSEVPQLMNYFFGLGAVLTLTLSAYHRMARAAGLPDKGYYHGIGLLAAYFCAAAVAQGVYVPFFCSAAVWMMTEMCRLRPAEEQANGSAGAA